MPLFRGTHYPLKGGRGFNPLSLNPVAFYKFDSGITVTGAGVSQWDDISGNGNHLLQGTDANRPALQSDGSILFNGTAHYLKTGAFTLNQPFTFYILANQITWTTDDRWCDGNTTDSTTIQQITATPQIRYFAGAGLSTISPVLSTYNIVSVVTNGASSVLQLNNETPVTGNAGANNAGGFTLAAKGAGLAGYCNIEVKEVLIFPVAHDSETRNRMIGYLAKVGGLSI